MGKRDSASNIYFSNKARFADLINGVCFEGKTILKPEDLSPWDSKTGKRTRDAVYLANFGVGFAVIGEESQETVDYSLPYRIMESDTGDYRKQVSDIKHQVNDLIENKDPAAAALTDGERLYRFRKSDKIYPVITIVLSNADVWDGPRDLWEMLDLEIVPKELLPLINNYRLNIIELPKLSAEYTSRFHSDLKQVLDILRVYRNKDDLEDLLKNDKAYESIDSEAYDLINTYVNLEKYGITEKQDKGGKINMANGFDGIIQKYTEIGEARGEARGEAKSEGKWKEVQLIEMICRKLAKNKPVEEIADNLDEDIARVAAICEAAREFSPEYDALKIYNKLHDKLAV